MSLSFPCLEDFAESNDSVQAKRRFFLFKDLVYKPTSETIRQGFRYFDCDMQDLLCCFARNDFKGIANLPFAMDDEGDSDTSGVSMSVWYVDSGEFVAGQVVEYRDHKPAPASPVFWMEGAAASAHLALFRLLDQSIG